MAAVRVESAARPTKEILAWSRATVSPAMREAVASLPTPMLHIAGYHLGWWDGDGKAISGDEGKAVRPALALLAAAAIGGRPEDAVTVAVAVELVHNFSLLHDDVIDGDETRRHRTTAWRMFGVGNAILAGDALLTLALQVVTAEDQPGRAEVSRTLCATVQALIDGQYADVAFESRMDVSLSECVRMATGKTGALLSCACRLGGMAAGGAADRVDELGRFGACLGLAFQIADDLQGIWGDPTATGKPAHSDLRNRKKSFPVVAALVSGTPASEELKAWLRQAPSPNLDLGDIAALVEAGGGRDWCHARLQELEAEALHHLSSVCSRGAPGAELEALTHLVTRRGPGG